MGIYLNPGNDNFTKALRTENYVDKTGQIQFLNSLVNTPQRFVCVSRPRRFGKTMAADMICAYYDRTAESRSLFERTLLPQCEPVVVGGEETQWDSYLKKFDVIKIDMSKFFNEDQEAGQSLKVMQLLVVREIKREYPGIDYFDEKNLVLTMDDVYSQVDRQVVFVIDEWDEVFRACQDDKEGQREYLKFLGDLLKDKPYIALAYMTGILPIKKFGMHSGPNMFREYTMMHPWQLAQYCGFTEEEVRLLCERHGRNFDHFKARYDGYVLRGIVPPRKKDGDLSLLGQDAPRYHVYCPLSVARAIKNRSLLNYWNNTESNEALNIYIQRDFNGLKDAIALLMDGGRIRIDTSTFQNDMTTFHNKDDVLSLLVHLGYLGFDSINSEVFIPNKEVMEVFKTCAKINSCISPTSQATSSTLARSRKCRTN